MTFKNPPSSLIVGLALFSMFFGSGNLIFPLLLGVTYQNMFWLAALGFIVTAVLLPTLGFLAMIPANGRYEELFTGLLQPKIARWFFLIVLIFWIPLGSGPRCVVLAHTSIATYLAMMPPVWLFALVYLALVYACVSHRTRLIDVLGKILTPLLLLIIFLLVVASLWTGRMPVNEEIAGSPVFLPSLVEGYYTQDLIAAIFFSSAIVAILKNNNLAPLQVLKKTLSGGLIAVSLLGILYTFLMAASAMQGDQLVGLAGDQLVASLAQISLGPLLGSVSAGAVSLACFTTEVALVLVFADFLSQQFFTRDTRKLTLIFTLGVIWLMSLLDFSGIMAVVAPAMQVIYPILFILVVRYLWINRTRFI
jgi:LIVCS family branched-chain amino acid:cation transporter